MTFLTGTRRPIGSSALPPFALLFVFAIPGGRILLAQTTKPPQRQSAVQPRHPAATPAEVVLKQRQDTPEAIATPPASLSSTLPADRPPGETKVIWDFRGLEIEASNSSLNQILRQVAAQTGAKLEGLTTDQRVFGHYGPGPGSAVLWKLLDGTGYNVLMIGGPDSGAPRKIVLSARLPASPRAATSNQTRTSTEPEPRRNYPDEALGPQPIQDPFANGAPPRDQAEFMQEILQRQQKIDQQNSSQQQ